MLTNRQWQDNLATYSLIGPLGIPLSRQLACCLIVLNTFNINEIKHVQVRQIQDTMTIANMLPKSLT